MSVSVRLAAVRERLAAEAAEALLVSDTSNVRYVTGFAGVFDEHAAALAVVSRDASALYTDSRYGEAAMNAAAGTEWEVHVPGGVLHEAACERLAEQGLTAIAVESSLPYRTVEAVRGTFASGDVAVLDGVVERVREVKDAGEIAHIAAACELGDRAFDHVLGVLRPGMTELDVALEIEVFLRRSGSEGVAFPSIVASGPHSAMPHATVTQRVLEAGDVVTMDFGARVGGYCSDMTRTVVLGSATDEVRRVYSAVLEAQLAGLDAVRGGETGVDIDRVARDVLAGAGLAEHFGHGLGHGVGLDVHEAPSISPRGTAVVRAGNVVTIEPGVYLAGRFGVRIEDSVVVEDAGCRVLTSSPKDLIEV